MALNTAAATAWLELRLYLNLAALSAGLGLHRNTAGQWRVVPADHVEGIQRLTGIPAHRLRPDLYPAPAGPMPWEQG